LSRFDSGAYSRLQFLRAVSHSVGAHTESLHPRVDNSSSSNSSEDEDEDKQAPVPSATTSGASESATAAATTSDDCCEVCIVAPRAGFALVPCGHRTRRQYTRRRNGDKENFLPINHTINHYFIVRPNVVQRAGQLSLPHVAISKSERNRTTNIKPMSSSYNTSWIKHKLVVSIYSKTETSLAMSTLAVIRTCRIVQSRDVRSHVFSRPVTKRTRSCM